MYVSGLGLPQAKRESLVITMSRASDSPGLIVLPERARYFRKVSLNSAAQLMFMTGLPYSRSRSPAVSLIAVSRSSTRLCVIDYSRRQTTQGPGLFEFGTSGFGILGVKFEAEYTPCAKAFSCS